MPFLSPNQRRQSGEGKDDFSRYREWKYLYFAKPPLCSQLRATVFLGTSDTSRWWRRNRGARWPRWLVATSGRSASASTLGWTRPSFCVCKRPTFGRTRRTTGVSVPPAPSPVRWKKRSETRKHCARAGCSKVRTPPARPLSQTRRQDRLQYTAPQLASAQCNNHYHDINLLTAIGGNAILVNDFS